MKKWRELFAVSQLRLSEKMIVSPSVISDYESGRRKSPGTRFIRRFVWALLKIDLERGSRLTREFARLTSSPSAAILDIREFPFPIRVEYLCKAISAEIVVSCEDSREEVLGYTIIDSKKAIETLSGWEFSQLFGTTTERALIFTNIDKEQSPMLLVRMHTLKPRMVVFHGTLPDELSKKLAEYDGVFLLFSHAPNVDVLVKSLRRLYRVALKMKLGRAIKVPPKISA